MLVRGRSFVAVGIILVVAVISAVIYYIHVSRQFERDADRLRQGMTARDVAEIMGGRPGVIPLPNSAYKPPSTCTDPALATVAVYSFAFRESLIVYYNDRGVLSCTDRALTMSLRSRR